MSETDSDSFVADRDEDTFGGEIVATASPATQIVLIYLVLTVVVGGALGAYLYQNPMLFGENGNARIAGLVVLGLTVIGAIRLAIKYIVLYRTRYIVTADSVRRQYHLAYREESRELPLQMIRGVELSKSRTQALLGFATISFLSVGSNRGIGYVEFDNAADPERLQTAVLELLEKQREQALEEDDESSDATDDRSPRGGRRQRDAPPAPQSATDGNARSQRTGDASNRGQRTGEGSDRGQRTGEGSDRGQRTGEGSDGGRGDDPLAESADTGGDDPLAESNDSGGDDTRRPVSGNDDAPSTAEPDARD
jgi:uncharacterized membrane protein YgcG